MLDKLLVRPEVVHAARLLPWRAEKATTGNGMLNTPDLKTHPLPCG